MAVSAVGFDCKQVVNGDFNTSPVGKINIPEVNADGIVKQLNALKNQQNKQKMQSGINDIKTYFSKIEDRSLTDSKELETVDDITYTKNGEPFSGTSKKNVKPGVVVYSTYQDGKETLSAVKYEKNYVIVERDKEKNINKYKVYTSDSKNKEYFNTIIEDKNNKKLSIHTLCGDDKKVKESYMIKNCDINEYKSGKNSKLALIRDYAVAKRLFGENAIKDVLYIMLYQMFIQGNKSKVI